MIKIITLGLIASLASVGFACAAPRHYPVKNQVAEQPKERLGTLSCEIAGGVGLLIGSNRAVDCTFKQRTGNRNGIKGRSESSVWTLVSRASVT